jgi:beta-lactam-binding protein with PASTA domain
LFKYITSKPLWANILAGILIVVILLFLFLQSLDWLTRHGKNLTIPAVTGKSYTDAKKALEEKGFEVEVLDSSTYNDTAGPMTVLRQFPDADANVKVNRTVYLTLNRSIAPTIEMPNLEGDSFRSAEMTLKQYGLRLGDTSYTNDFAKNNVREMQYSGSRIKPGDKIKMGSSIDLVLGDGRGKDEFSVPPMVGSTYSEAIIRLQALNLNITLSIQPGSQEIKDTSNAYIYRQYPEAMTPDRKVNHIQPGQSIQVWLQTEKPAPQQADTTNGGTNAY